MANLGTQNDDWLGASTHPSPFVPENAQPLVSDLDSQLVRNTKAAITQSVLQLSALSKEACSSELFYERFLPGVCNAMGALAASVWRRDRTTDTWHLIARTSDAWPQWKSLIEETGPTPLHRRLLDCIHEERQAVVVPPAHVAVEGNRPCNPTQHLLLLAPAPVSVPQGEYWLQVVQTAQGGPATQRGFLRFVAQSAEYLADHLKLSRLRELEQDQAYIAASESLLIRISHARPLDEHLRDWIDTLAALAKADQVFLAVRKSPRSTWKILQASGLKSIDRHTEGIRAVGDAIQEAWSDETQSEEPQGIASSAPEGMQRFQKLFGSSYTLWIPLDGSRTRSTVGCWLHWVDAQKPSVAYARWKALARVGLSAIRPTWWRKVVLEERGVRHPWEKVQAVSTKVKIAVSSLIVMGIGAFPVPFHVDAPARLHPVSVQRLYAPSHGVVSHIEFDYGQRVEAGQIVLSIEDRQLLAQLEEAIGAQSKNEERMRELENRLRRSTTNEALAQRDQIEAEKRTLAQAIQSQHRRMELLQDFKKRLDLRADAASQVATWDAIQHLRGRPVKEGQLLLSLVDTTQGWFVEAEIDERDLGPIQPIANAGAPAEVVLSHDPLHALNGSIVSIDEQVTRGASAEASSFVRMKIALPPESTVQGREGTTARVRLNCGKSPLAWVLLRDVTMSLWIRVRSWI